MVALWEETGPLAQRDGHKCSKHCTPREKYFQPGAVKDRTFREENAPSGLTYRLCNPRQLHARIPLPSNAPAVDIQDVEQEVRDRTGGHGKALVSAWRKGAPCC